MNTKEFLKNIFFIIILGLILFIFFKVCCCKYRKISTSNLKIIHSFFTIIHMKKIITFFLFYFGRLREREKWEKFSFNDFLFSYFLILTFNMSLHSNKLPALVMFRSIAWEVVGWRSLIFTCWWGHRWILVSRGSAIPVSKRKILKNR